MEVNWLDDLEKKVEKVLTELKSLRQDNDSQERQIKQLQEQLAEAKSAGKSVAGWDKERAEIKKRVEKLSACLEKLL